MKILTGIAMAIAILILVAWHSIPTNALDSGEHNEVCIQVITEAREPSTGKVYEFPTPCDVPEGWDVLEGGGQGSFEDQGATYQNFRNQDLGISFAYRTAPDGNIMLEPDASLLTNPTPVLYRTIVNEKAYQELMASSMPREGPPMITIMVFENPDNLSPEEWIAKYPRRANYDPQQDGQWVTLTHSTVGGLDVVRYRPLGLYDNDAVVATQNGYAYLLIGSYSYPQDPIRTDFLYLLDSLVFF